MSEEHPDRKVSKWVPESDALRLRVLGKLIEELSEAGAIAARCVIQGIGESEPTTGKPNQQALEEEIADVLACIELAFRYLPLERFPVEHRKDVKLEYLGLWCEVTRISR